MTKCVVAKSNLIPISDATSRKRGNKHWVSEVYEVFVAGCVILSGVCVCGNEAQPSCCRKPQSVSMTISQTPERDSVPVNRDEKYQCCFLKPLLKSILRLLVLNLVVKKIEKTT